MIQFVTGFGIDDLYPVQFNFQPCGTIHDLVFIADHDNIRNSFRNNIGGCDKCPFVCRLRQNDGLFVLSRLFFDHVNI